MLKSISIKNVASYDNNGILIENLKKINFFYGSNGVGKTTISNYLSNLSLEKYSNCLIEWENDFSKDILVYNKQFKDNNFREGKIAGVFTLGNATKEILDLIDEKSKKVSDLDDSINIKTTTIKKQNEKLLKEINSFTEITWRTYKKYEESFKNVFKGHMGSKPAFKDKIEKEINENTSEVIHLEELRDKVKTLFKGEIEKLQNIEMIRYQDIHEIENNTIFSKSIIGKEDVNISKLIKILNNNDWVNQGMKYITDNGVCPFCQQNTLTQELINEFENFFDDNFKQETAVVRKLHNDYINIEKQANLYFEEIEKKEKINPKINLELLIMYKIEILKNISENKSIMNEKINNLSHKIEISITDFSKLNELIININLEIDKHNEMLSNIKQEKEKIKSKVWKYICNEIDLEYKTYKKNCNGLTNGIEKINKEIKEKEEEVIKVKKEIVELNRDVTSIQPTIDEINRLLKFYGFNNFELASSSEIENHYILQREDGSLAHSTLSEGEITFITFIYFLQLIKKSSSDGKVISNKILVIDDPISSLDSNVLFIVSTLIKQLIYEVKDDKSIVKQLIVLSHNVYFHKEVSFIDGRTKKNKDTFYWILKKTKKITSIKAYGEENPIETSYELLWREIKEWQNNSGITIQNVMRRIIENYFKILGKMGDDDLINKFETNEEKTICRSLLCWVNDGSHCVSDDLFIATNENQIDLYLEVFKKVFEYTNNKGHYEMMMT